MLMLIHFSVKAVKACSGAVRWQACFTDLCDPLPVTSHHGFVRHELQQGAALAEFIDGFLQVQESLPLLQGPGQLATPGN